MNPPSAADDDMRPWLDGLLEKAITERQSLVVDLGGGDQLLKHAAMEFGLAEFLERNGVTPVMLHFVGGDSDDLAYLREADARATRARQDGNRFQCRGVPAGVSLDAAWSKHENDPALQSAVGRGAQLVRIPRLACMTLLDDKRIRFTDANAGEIGLTNAQRVLMWLREMDGVCGHRIVAAVMDAGIAEAASRLEARMRSSAVLSDDPLAPVLAGLGGPRPRHGGIARSIGKTRLFDTG